MGLGREWLKTTLLVTLLLLVAVLVLQLQRLPSPAVQEVVISDCSTTELLPASPTPSSSSAVRLLSYQPPGNGWNNQRIALENALVLAKLLNRTLLVHPLAPHELGNKMKAGLTHGYLAYNKLHSSDLLPPSRFLDLDLMSQVVPVEEVTASHPEFVTAYRHLTWRNICHTPGYGFWVDQVPQTAAQVELLSRQRFSSLGRVWRDKCPEEKHRAEKNPESVPFVRYVSDLQQDQSEMLYFEHGTLFGIQLRFTTESAALQAQKWVVDHVHYSPEIWRVVEQIGREIGPRFNAIQVRRKNHMDSKLPASYWMQRMADNNFSHELPVYVATNDATMEWFRPFLRDGYLLYFSTNLSNHLVFPDIQESLRNDLLGIHEQCLCMNAGSFVGSPASTFNALILRQRGERLRVRKFYSTLQQNGTVLSGRTSTFLHVNQIQANKMVLYKDDDIIAVNKPSGLAVHAGPKLSNDLSHYRHYWQYEQPEPPELAHRLDKATSGVLILTRHKGAARWIAQLFHQQKIVKKYWAITVNVPPEMKGSIKSRLVMRNIASSGGRHSMNRVVMKENGEGSCKLAWTDYEVLSVPEPSPRRCSLIQLQPVTGYKHQLRVHLADGLKCPIFGDHQFGGPVYRRERLLKKKVQNMNLERDRLYLHSVLVAIPGYFGDSSPPLVIHAPLPDHFNKAIQLLKLTVPNMP